MHILSVILYNPQTTGPLLSRYYVQGRFSAHIVDFIRNVNHPGHELNPSLPVSDHSQTFALAVPQNLTHNKSILLFCTLSFFSPEHNQAAKWTQISISQLAYLAKLQLVSGNKSLSPEIRRTRGDGTRIQIESGSLSGMCSAYQKDDWVKDTATLKTWKKLFEEHSEWHSLQCAESWLQRATLELGTGHMKQQHSKLCYGQCTKNY